MANCVSSVPECDNCALTLLRDLENLDDELERVKNQLDNVSVSTTSKDRLGKLEKAMSDTKVTCLPCSGCWSGINAQSQIRIRESMIKWSTLLLSVEHLFTKYDRAPTS